MSREKQNSFRETIRIDCPMRHETGNCLVSGGFCTAVNTPICEALHNAYNAGKTHSIEEMKKQGYRKQSEGEWILCEHLYDYEVDTWKCSQCQTFIRDDEKRKMKFCPNCGAKMKGV